MGLDRWPIEVSRQQCVPSETSFAENKEEATIDRGGGLVEKSKVIIALLVSISFHFPHQSSAAPFFFFSLNYTLYCMAEEAEEERKNRFSFSSTISSFSTSLRWCAGLKQQSKVIRGEGDREKEKKEKKEEKKKWNGQVCASEWVKNPTVFTAMDFQFLYTIINLGLGLGPIEIETDRKTILENYFRKSFFIAHNLLRQADARDGLVKALSTVRLFLEDLRPPLLSCV